MQHCALYNDGLTPETAEVSPQMSAGSLVFEHKGEPCRWPLSRIDAVDGWSSRPLRLKRTPDTYERLTLPAGSRTDEIVRHIRMHRGIRLPVISKFGVAALTAVVAMVCWGIFMGDVTTRFIASCIPHDVEKAMGRQAMESLLPLLSLNTTPEWCTSAESQAALDAMQSELLSPEDPQPYEIRILHSSFNNALAIPGGTILVTSALINDLQHPDELSGILAHERTHITQHHGTTSYVRNAAFSMVLKMFAANSDTLRMIGGSAQALMLLRFSREAEDAADSGAVRALHRAGIPIGRLQDFLVRAAPPPEDGDTTLQLIDRYLSTHPDTPHRVKAMQAQYDALGTPPPRQSPLSSRQWQAVKNACSRRTDQL
jgi:predicted Zn-dependent protease